MFAGSHVAQEVRPGPGGQGPAYGAGHVVVPGGDVGDQGAQHVEGRAVAQALLQDHVGLHLV